VTTPAAGEAARGPAVSVRSLDLRRLVVFAGPLLAVAGLVAAVWAVAGEPLPAVPAVVGVVGALVGCLAALSAALLIGRFQETGDLRVLALSWAYVCSLVMSAGWAAAFPGVWVPVGHLVTTPSVAAWLWVAWHSAFLVLLALSVLPLPAWTRRAVRERRRRWLAWGSVAGAALAGGVVVAAVVAAGPRLPVVISGSEGVATTSPVGPVVVPVVLGCALLAVLWGWRRTGPARWVSLAATATAANLTLTLTARDPYSLGWYAGCALSVAAAAAVLLAMIRESHSMRRLLDADAAQLRRLLLETGRLERLQATLLDNIVEGVLLQDAGGRVIASNPAARRILALSAAELHGQTLSRMRSARRPEGGDWSAQERPTAATVRNGAGVRGQIVGVYVNTTELRWLSVNTDPVMHPSGEVEYVVSSIRDVTAQHAAAVAEQQAARERTERVQQVLDEGGPGVVVQPIVELATGRTVGVEALARFPETFDQPPDVWFADADAAGLGTQLELAAIERALAVLDQLPPDIYLSVNATPAVIAAPELFELFAAAGTERLVLEMTEHIPIADYDRLAGPLNRLRWAGVRLAVDDAGAGFSSLQHILNLAPDLIKLDRALVRDIDSDPARASLAASLVTFAERIGADLVAEGIETDRERTALLRLGIHCGQGFRLGRPVPVAALSAPDTVLD
jgi:PAS domain S-box-containing protein